MIQVPARIEKLTAEKQFYAAVQLHVQSALMLEREGLQTVRFLFKLPIIILMGRICVRYLFCVRVYLSHLTSNS